MPYAQIHYPFENKELFEKTFPSDFVSEGIDQTRGWFYTLLVIATHLFDKAPWKNLIVHGLVLASLVAYTLSVIVVGQVFCRTGKKMSKSLKNYPDPFHVINTYGSDALRYTPFCLLYPR